MNTSGARVFVALGSNLGDKCLNLAQARAALASLPGTKVVSVSRIYLTAPVGGPEQDSYLNQVAELETRLEPKELLRALQRIEDEAGRERTVRWGPRTLDLDILWYHGVSIADPELLVPHPRMEERRFVLEPLADLAPDLRLASGRTVREALCLVGDQEVSLLADHQVAEEELGLGVHEEMGDMTLSSLQEEIRRLAAEKKALILAHNYQRPEIQDVADVVGDSLALARHAAASDARLIVLCGVHFMAETAAILVPDRPVIIPEPEAGCSMADMVDVDGLVALKDGYPDAVVVTYVNSSAAVKAVSDICCTSANAVEIVASVPRDRPVIFTPDRNLALWAAKKAGREVILWPGFCPTHELITVGDVLAARRAHPGAKLVVHPECQMEVAELADAVESTSGMLRFCRADDSKEYLIGTEVGMLYRLRKDLPDKRFYPVTELAVCPYMKLATVPGLLEVLREEAPVVSVDPETRARALRAVERMLEVGS